MVEAPAAGATELGGGGHWHGTRCHSHVIARDACPGIVPGSSSGGWGMSRDTLQGQASPGDEALSLPLQTGHWKAGPRKRRRAVNAHPQRMHGKKQTNKLCYLKTSGRGAANIQTPMPRSCGCHFHGDRHFANTMNLKIWTWGDNFGLHGGPSAITQVLTRWRRGGRKRRQKQRRARGCPGFLAASGGRRS